MSSIIKRKLERYLHLEGVEAIQNDILIHRHVSWQTPLTALADVAEEYPESGYATYCVATALLSLAQETRGTKTVRLAGVNDALRERIPKIAAQRQSIRRNPRELFASAYYYCWVDREFAGRLAATAVNSLHDDFVVADRSRELWQRIGKSPAAPVIPVP